MGPTSDRKRVGLGSQSYMSFIKATRNSVKPLVNVEPKKINAKRFVSLHHVFKDFNRLQEMYADNKDLFTACFCMKAKPREMEENPNMGSSRRIAMDARLRKIQEENVELGKKIEEIRKASRPKSKFRTKVPHEVIQMYKNVVPSPKDVCLQHQLFRPKVYFDILVKNNRALERVVIQLFTEACPMIVLEFVRFCALGCLRRIQFPRIYSMLWAEGEMDVGPRELEFTNFNPYAVDCHSDTGIVSFATQDFRAFEDGMLAFAISFRPLTIDVHKRFAFGRVIGGRNSFLCLSDFGTKCGNRIRDVCVTGMGILHD